VAATVPATVRHGVGHQCGQALTRPR
jgi:hypothetical protein